MERNPKSTEAVILVTGAARRIGAAIATYFHQQHYRVLVHYRRSAAEAQALCAHLNTTRANSAVAIQADLNSPSACDTLIQTAIDTWGRLDVLVNNASDYFPTTIGETSAEQWAKLMHSNLMAPYFLTQAAVSQLQNTRGNIVNIIDIHAEKPLKGYAVYCAAKAGLRSLTQSLARELAPHVRVNGIAPGATLWPEAASEIADALKTDILTRTPLQQLVDPNDIAKTVWFCTNNASMTGDIIHVDCGRSLHM